MKKKVKRFDKRIIWIILILVLIAIFILLLVFYNNVSDNQILKGRLGSSSLFAFGTGSVSDPYLITNCTDLQNMNSDLIGNYVLGNDIDCSDTINWNLDSESGSYLGFEPVGEFSGVLDGKGFKINNLYINRSSNAGLLFGRNAVIKNLIIDGAEVYSQGNAGILGVNCYNCNVDRVIISGNVSGIQNIGGIFSYMAGNISRSSFKGIIYGSTYIGGMCGMFNGIINNSYTEFNVISINEVSGYVGGLFASGYGSIQNSYSNGNLSNTAYSGGLAGVFSGTIINSFSISSVGYGYLVGGLVGVDPSGGMHCENINVINSYWSSSNSPAISTCYCGLNAGCNSIDDINYFYNFSNEPMASWDTGIWNNNTGGNKIGGLVGFPISITFVSPENNSVLTGDNVAVKFNFTIDRPADVQSCSVFVNGNENNVSPIGAYNYIEINLVPGNYNAYVKCTDNSLSTFESDILIFDINAPVSTPSYSGSSSPGSSTFVNTTANKTSNQTNNQNNNLVNDSSEELVPETNETDILLPPKNNASGQLFKTVSLYILFIIIICLIVWFLFFVFRKKKRRFIVR